MNRIVLLGIVRKVLQQAQVRVLDPLIWTQKEVNVSLLRIMGEQLLNDPRLKVLPGLRFPDQVPIERQRILIGIAFNRLS
ncbi:hypothetical protein ASL20_13950 [Cupriavidus necator]|nr:hypothetical protein ASL20_13950 [Cupriavidus necator]